MPLRTFRDAVALITGGASGIGLALAHELASRGAGEIVLADVRLDAAKKAAAEVGPKARAAALDVTDASAFATLVRETHDSAGRLDYLFNNAGIGVVGPVESHTLEHWNRILDVNVRGVVHGVHAAYPLFQKQGFGHIVNTASIAGLIPAPLFGAYCASKFAVVGLTRVLRPEAQAFGVRVSVLCPGVIRTPLLTGGAFGQVLSPTPISDERILRWWGRFFPIDAPVLARRALDKIARNREVIVVPGWLRGPIWLYRGFPWLERGLLKLDYARTRRAFPELLGRK